MILECSGSLMHSFDFDNPWLMILAIIHNTVCLIMNNFSVRSLSKQLYNAFHQHEWYRIRVYSLTSSDNDSCFDFYSSKASAVVSQPYKMQQRRNPREFITL